MRSCIVNEGTLLVVVNFQRIVALRNRVHTQGQSMDRVRLTGVGSRISAIARWGAASRRRELFVMGNWELNTVREEEAPSQEID